MEGPPTHPQNVTHAASGCGFLFYRSLRAGPARPPWTSPPERGDASVPALRSLEASARPPTIAAPPALGGLEEKKESAARHWPAGPPTALPPLLRARARMGASPPLFKVKSRAGGKSFYLTPPLAPPQGGGEWHAAQMAPSAWSLAVGGPPPSAAPAARPCLRRPGKKPPQSSLCATFSIN